MEAIGKRDRDDGSAAVDALLESFGDAPSDAQRLRVAAEDRKPQRWTAEEDEVLRVAVEKHGQRNWKLIAAEVPGRNHGQCQQRWNKVLKPGLVKGHWSEEEDTMLKQMALQGCHSWTDVAAQIPGRTPKQCRERWRNHLDPSINRAPFTPDEDFTIQQAYEQMGNRWTKIAELVPGRTEDAVKTRWKALNPFRKTNDRPGRPRRMPDIDEISTLLRSDNFTVTGLHQQGYEHAYDALASMLLSMVPSQPALQATVQTSGETNTAVANGSELPEPIVEPLHEEYNRIDSKDAAILRELLRSHTSSIMSFGSTRDVSSFADISPDELLGSGELDEMLKAASQSTDGVEIGTNVSATSAKALIKTLKNLSNSQEKHIFEELIDAVRAASGVEPSEDGSNRSLDFFSTASGRDLLDVLTASGHNLGHSLDFDRSSVHTTSPEISALEGEDTDEDGDEDDEDDDLLKPIHIGKRSVSSGNDDGLSDLLKPIHLGKRSSFVGQSDVGF